MDSWVTTIGGKLAERWALDFLVPPAIFVILLAAMSYSMGMGQPIIDIVGKIQAAADPQKTDWIAIGGTMLALALGLLILGVILRVLEFPVIRLMEGYFWLLSRQARSRIAAYQKSQATLQKKINCLNERRKASQGASNGATIKSLEDLLDMVEKDMGNTKFFVLRLQAFGELYQLLSYSEQGNASSDMVCQIEKLAPRFEAALSSSRVNIVDYLNTLSNEWLNVRGSGENAIAFRKLVDGAMRNLELKYPEESNPVQSFRKLIEAKATEEKECVNKWLKKVEKELCQCCRQLKLCMLNGRLSEPSITAGLSSFQKIKDEVIRLVDAEISRIWIELSEAEASLTSDFPREKHDVMPTKLGNILRSAERRPNQKYGLDGVLLYPRLWLILPENMRTILTDSRAHLNLATRMFMVCVVLLLAAPVQTVWVIFSSASLLKVGLGIVFSAAAALFACLAYLWMCNAARYYGVMIDAVFDVHQGQLSKLMDMPRGCVAIEKRRITGAQLTKFIGGFGYK